MFRRFVGAGLLLAFVLASAVPVNGADKDKKKADDKPVTDSDTLKPGQFSGKLKTPPASDGSFIVSVEYSHLELKNPNQLAKFQKANPGLQNAIRDQQRIAQLQAQLNRARTQQEAVRTIQQLQDAMNKLQTHQIQAMIGPQGQQSPYVVKTDTKDITFHAAEEMKVRFSKPPSAFTEKGDVKTYTKEELQKLKGEGADAKLEGYQGSVDKLTAGMPVRVTTILNKPKKEEKKPEDKKAEEDKKVEEAKKAEEEKKAEEAKKAEDKDKAKDAPAEKKDMGPKTVVSLILVNGDESSGTGSDNPKKKK